MIDILGIILSVFVFVALFGLTIFVHELGHFLAAISTGMVVDVFSIGFGPALWKKKIKGVVVKVGAIPFGGYVAIPQLDPSSMSKVQGGAEGEEEKRVLPDVSPWKRIYVSIAGVVGNVILAVILAWVVFLSPSAMTEAGSAVIGSVTDGSVAAEAGIEPGDRILSVNGEKVKTWTEYVVLCVLAGEQAGEVTLEIESGGETSTVVLPTVEGRMDVHGVQGLQKSALCAVSAVREGSAAEDAGLKPRDIIMSIDGIEVRNSQHMVELVSARGGKTIPVVVTRSGKSEELTVAPRHDEKTGRAVMGVEFGEVHILPWMQYKRPMDQLKNDVWHIGRLLKALVTPKEAAGAAKGLGGPPMILFTLWMTIRLSLLNAIGFIRFLNINLAILNLLPIPVLDGGHIVFALWEVVTRRKPHPKVVNALVNVFAALLIGAILFLSVRDFVKMPKFFKDKGEAEAVEQSPPPSEDAEPDPSPEAE